MNYLLTKEEYDELTARQRQRTEKEVTELQEFCTMVAEQLPVQWWGTTVKPWGCILNSTIKYCDRCPSQKVCPYPGKEWSK